MSSNHRPAIAGSALSLIYIISLKRNLEGKINYTYGQQAYDFDNGTKQHQIFNRVEEVLEGYLNSDELIKKGLPTVNFIAEALNISPTY